MTQHHKLMHVLVEYDRKQSKKPFYNMWALPQYMKRLDDVEKDIAAGTPVRKAIIAGFCGPVVNKLLKAAGESNCTDQERNAESMWGYTPVSTRKGR